MSTTHIAAILSVKDEVELILPAIENLEGLGVGEIVVRDCCSTDGTQDVLAMLVAQGRIRGHRHDDLGVDAPRVFEEVVELAQSCHSEWVLVLDADEFPLTALSDLRHCPELLTDRYDFVRLPRRNVVPGPNGLGMRLPPNGQNLDDIRLVARPIEGYWQNPELQASKPWILSAIAPRTIGRRSALQRVLVGLHEMRGASDSTDRHVDSTSVVVAHVPFSSEERFFRKAQNIHQIMSAHEAIFAGPGAYHWKKWRNCLLNGTLDAEYTAQWLDADTLRAWESERVVTSAAQFLESLRKPLAG